MSWGLVPDTLEVGDHLHGRGDGPQVPGHRLLPQQELEAAVLDVPLHLVHGGGHLDGGLCRRLVLGGEALGDHVDGVLGGAGHGGELLVELQELCVKGLSHDISQTSR